MQPPLTTYLSGPKTILVIDDAASLREEIAATLECLDFQVITAENGTTGVKLARAHLPELIICDIMMPDMDGYGVYACLHQHPSTANIPFIFLSAKADRSDIRKGMNLGADDYLTKPFTSEELGEAIIARLSKREAITQPYLEQMKQASVSLVNLAYTDPLTQLPNRISLYHALQEKVAHASNAQQVDGFQPLVAVLCVGIKELKQTDLGLDDVMLDGLLQQIAQRLKSFAHSKTIVARLGQDEFSLVLSNYQKVGQVDEFAKALLDNLAQPYPLANQNLFLHPHIGVSLYPVHGASADQLLSAANLALHHVQKINQSGHQFFNAEIERSSQERRLIATNLGEALKHTEFELHYQPQISLLTGKIIGAEALLRWFHPMLGKVNPETFLSVAEETKHSAVIMDWVLQQVCLQQQDWQKIALTPMPISVNLSAHQLYEANLVDRLTAILEETSLNPDLLYLEVSEATVADDLNAAKTILKALKNLGVHIAVDDFGTGQMSLVSLHRLPIDVLKIHQSLIKQLPDQTDYMALMTSLLTLAKSLKFQVVAEGVETQNQFKCLQKSGFYAFQGNLASPAICVDRFERLLVSDFRFEAAL